MSQHESLQDRTGWVEGKGIHTPDICLQHMSRLSTVNTNTTPNSRTQIHVNERFLCKYVQHVAQRPGTNPAVQPSNGRTTGSNITFCCWVKQDCQHTHSPPRCVAYFTGCQKSLRSKYGFIRYLGIPLSS